MFEKKITLHMFSALLLIASMWVVIGPANTVFAKMPAKAIKSPALQQSTAGGHEFHFAPDKLYLANLDHALTINPALTWNTFLGGNGDDEVDSIAIDNSGNVYLVGLSGSTWGNPIQPHTATGNDAFVAKLDSSGNLVWNTFLGGSGDDVATSITVDGGGKVYIAGHSAAAWGSPVRAYTADDDAFAAKLEASNGSLTWNTFLGGEGDDISTSIAVDGSGNLYVGGHSSAIWGTPVQAYIGGNDAFAAKLDNFGNLGWNTFLGGNGTDDGASIKVDGNKNVYLAGYSNATWGNPVQAYSGNHDAFAAKLNSSGSLTWSTFLGGASTDQGKSITVDSSGNVYVAGFSDATWGSPIRAHDTIVSTTLDAFAAKLDSSGSLIWNTFLGGNGNDQGFSIAVDDSGDIIYLAGYGDATWGSPVRTYTAGNDAFVTKVDRSGNLEWNTFLGGSGSDYNNFSAIAVDSSGNVHVAGQSDSNWGSPVRTYTAGSDGFVAKLNFSNGQTTPFSVFGTGADGNLTVPAGQTIYTDDTRSAVSINASSGQPNISVVSTSGFAIGQEVMVIQSQGAGVGNYEFNTIIGINGNTLTLGEQLQNTYTVVGNSKSQIIRIYQYNNVLIQNGGTLTSSAWDGSTGGVIIFRVKDTFTVDLGGSVNATGRGYRGGAGGLYNSAPPISMGVQGESYIGIGTRSSNSNGGGGGGAEGDTHSDCLTAGCSGAGGGGGGYGFIGLDGMQAGDKPVLPGAGGTTYGVADLSTSIFFGSGGGGGGSDDDNGGYGGTGGAGGGIVMISARQMSVSGIISANGSGGTSGAASYRTGGGGGGSGGTIYLQGDNLMIGASTQALGASGWAGINGGGDGGTGGKGRIRIEYSTSLDGPTNPIASTQQTMFGPAVTINQSQNQSDPTSASSINFTAIFSKPINVSTFTSNDITLDGSTGATNMAISQIAPNDGTTFNIAVSGMTNSGTVTASLDAAKVTDLVGNPNTASRSSDNNVIYSSETDPTCQNVPTITPGQDRFGNLVTTDDINPYKFDVTSPYTTIVATLTPPANSDFALYLFDSCQDGPINLAWGEIGRRYIHIGRRYIHIGPGGDSKTEVRFNVGKNTGTYYLAVEVPQDGVYDLGQYQLHLELQQSNIGLMDTLILYNPTRFKQKYGLDAASQMMDKLTQLAQHPRVNGLIMQLDQYSDVASAYNKWDTTSVINANEISYKTNVTNANIVSNAIRTAMLAFMKANNRLATSYVVVVGDDNQIPFRRLDIKPDPIIPDPNWMTERNYLSALGDTPNTPTDAALMANQTLSDDYYGDYTDRPWAGNWPSLAVGRLLDTPARIENTINAFISKNGVIDLTTSGSAAIAGYDFLADSAQTGCNQLTSTSLTSTDCTLIDTSAHPNKFTANTLSQKFITSAPNIAGYYGHTNHGQIFTPIGNPLIAEQISANNSLTSSLWWVIGCQSGLVLPNSEKQALSLTQALGDHGVPYLGNTGWAWGSDGPSAYSELLYQLLTDKLTQNGGMAVGEALRLAKRDYFYKTMNNISNQGKNELLSYYDAKVMSEATLYGLPMLEFDFPSNSPTSAASTAPTITSKSSITTQALPAQLTLWSNALSNLTYMSQVLNGNTYYINSQDKYGIGFKTNTPILPLSNTFDFKTSYGIAKGVVWIGGAYTQQKNNPLIATPRQLNGIPVAESAFNGTYPLLPITLASLTDINGKFSNNMSIQTAQYNGNQTSGTLRLFTQMNYLVSLWNGALGDVTPPTVENPVASVNGNFLHLQLPVTDTSGVNQVYLTYTFVNNNAPNGSWQSIQKAGTCIAGRQIYNLDLPLPVTGEVDYFIQVMDCAGNVAVKMNSGKYYQVNTLGSLAAQDGWILESAENSSIGGTMNSTAATFNLGDDDANKQYLGMLHFDTSSLPDNAVITSVMLKIMKQGLVGTNPFSTHGGLLVDIRKPFFGTTTALAIADFQSLASKPAVATFSATPIGSWYSATLGSAAYPFINLTGTTQLRLRFAKDDNNDLGADYLSFFSGNATAANRPSLIVQYYIP